MKVHKERELFSINARYLIDPSATHESLANDIGCLIESTYAGIELVIEGLSDAGSGMRADPKFATDLLYGLQHNLCMVKGISAALSLREARL